MKFTKARTGVALAALVAIGATALAPMAYAATWTRTASYSTWTGTKALERAQGVATDNTYYYYSGTYGMAKATIANDTEVASTLSAIPSSLASAYGTSHIGDIDYYGGYVIAPLEDSSSYSHPLLALYDTNLNYTGRYVQLPLSLMPGGVPWVAVDAAAGLVYTAPWSQDATQGTNRLVAYSLQDLLTLPAGSQLPVVKTVTLSRPLSRIQGATMFNGQLYASVDISSDKSVYSIDPVTGVVTWQFHQDVQPNDEVQGITAVNLGATGGQLHILNVGSGWKSIFVYFQHYAITG